MTDPKETATLMTPRRGFFTRVAGIMALGAAAFAPTAPHAEGEADDGPNWPGKLTGRHKQVTDMYAINDGFPLGFVHNFLEPNKSATGVMILRHEAFPLALNHTMWEKYKIGEAEKINDPETKAPAVKNPYFQAKPGVCAMTTPRSINCLRAVRCLAPAISHCGPMPDGSPRMPTSRRKKRPRNSLPTSFRGSR